ncbi:MAG: TRAP transporter small permease, partial [Alphaproteobacteria bacterium]|nr:TRAP transporter small permease [Alphaproteobacteria bacterium]
SVLIVVDVGLRNLGRQPPAHTLALTEYALLYATLLGAPWLLRTRGHVTVDMVTGSVGPGLRRLMARLTSLIGLAACLAFAWSAAQVTWSSFTRASFDMRSFDMPQWLLFVVMVPSFLLMAIEFGHLMIGPDPPAESAEESWDQL